ncbi:hypothetical protein [Microscilla marina]|uniref:Uncharacterized protein n=1 Tax=Microscilla marina ATCC 23134 TaxID=313606 RepID=A1ZZR9_MICM2|nr:hypothetical protein [Microscilla marina]EAY24127.1 hypothetical protein M23134_06044 [Microscilla marina ATCC 23134]
MEKHPFYAKDQIAAYLNGTMSDVQMEAFEKLLNNDPFFEAIVEGARLQRVAKKMLDEEPELLKGYDQMAHDRILSNIKANMQKAVLETTDKKTTVKPLHTRWTWKTTAAAAAVLLIGMGTWTYQKAQNTDLPGGDALATKYVSDKTLVDLTKISVKATHNPTKATTGQIESVINPQTLASNNTTQSVVTKVPVKEVTAKTLTNDPSKDKEMQQLIAINKQEIKYWEDELSNYQTSRGADAVSVISPITGNDLAAKEVVFEVKYEGKSTLLLTIYNAQSMTKAVVMELPLKKVKDNKTIKHVMNDLKKGTYYWKLTNEEEELFIGKFKKVK